MRRRHPLPQRRKARYSNDFYNSNCAWKTTFWNHLRFIGPFHWQNSNSINFVYYDDVCNVYIWFGREIHLRQIAQTQVAKYRQHCFIKGQNAECHQEKQTSFLKYLLLCGKARPWPQKFHLLLMLWAVFEKYVKYALKFARKHCLVWPVFQTYHCPRSQNIISDIWVISYTRIRMIDLRSIRHGTFAADISCIQAVTSIVTWMPWQHGTCWCRLFYQVQKATVVFMLTKVSSWLIRNYGIRISLRWKGKFIYQIFLPCIYTW